MYMNLMPLTIAAEYFFLESISKKQDQVRLLTKIESSMK